MGYNKPMTDKKVEPIKIKEMLEQFKKEEKALLDSLEPGKLYHRILPDMTDEKKKRAKITFVYNRIFAFGTFDGKKTITIDRIHATEGAKEGDLQAIVKLIKEKVGEGDIEVVFEV